MCPNVSGKGNWNASSFFSPCTNFEACFGFRCDSVYYLRYLPLHARPGQSVAILLAFPAYLFKNTIRLRPSSSNLLVVSLLESTLTLELGLFMLLHQLYGICFPAISVRSVENVANFRCRLKTLIFINRPCSPPLHGASPWVDNWSTAYVCCRISSILVVITHLWAWFPMI